MIKNRRMTMLAAALGVTALALTGCGAGSASLSGDAGPANADLPTVHVAGVPSENMSAINFGAAKGFFDDAGLNVEVVPAQGGAAIINGVVQGSQEFGYATVPPLAVARANGQKIVGVTGSGYMYPDVNITQVAVAADSPIQSFEDLKGKKVGVNQVKSFLDTCLSAWFEKNGGATTAATPVEMPFSQLVPSTEKGQVDASVLTEPFTTQGKQAGLRMIGDICGAALPETTSVGMFFTSEQYKADHPDLVKKFNEAMTTTINYLDEHPDEFAKQIAKDGQLDDAAAAQLEPRKQRAEILPEPMKEYLDTMAAIGLIPAASVDDVYAGLIQ